MVFHTENSIICTVRHSFIAIALIASGPYWSNAVLGQTPPAVTGGQSPGPTVARANSSTPGTHPAATKGAAEAAPAGAPTAGPNAEATSSARSSLCKRYVEVLSGR